MLRIDRQQDTEEEIRLRIEGQLAAEWVGLLEEQCLQEVARVGAGGIALDLGQITYVDAAGRRLLRRLKSTGVRLVKCPPLLESILDEGPEYDDSTRS